MAKPKPRAAEAARTKPKARELSPAEEIAAIRKIKKHYVTDPRPKRWLDTRSENLNAVLGSPDKGIPYGKILEMSGRASHGKTMIALFLCALAQREGSRVVWLDFENSFDPPWVAAQGLDPDGVYLLRPEMGRFGKKTGKLMIQSGEELFAEVEELVERLRERDPSRGIVLAVDSVAAILPKAARNASIDGQNMSTSLALAKFMSQFLMQWTPFGLNHDVLSIFINQIRTSPGVLFGNPEKTPGGEALPFYASTRVYVRRVKGGRLMRLNQVIGLRGKITNIKNKAGEGSVEGRECGYATRFGNREWLFPNSKEVAKDRLEGWSDQQGEDDE